MANLSSQVVSSLKDAYAAFQRCDVDVGFKKFSLAVQERPEILQKISYKMWELKGSPTRETAPFFYHDRFGELHFFNQENRWSAPSEKATVIRQCLEDYNYTVFTSADVKELQQELESFFKQYPDLLPSNQQELETMFDNIVQGNFPTVTSYSIDGAMVNHISAGSLFLGIKKITQAVIVSTKLKGLIEAYKKAPPEKKQELKDAWKEWASVLPTFVTNTLRMLKAIRDIWFKKIPLQILK